MGADYFDGGPVELVPARSYGVWRNLRELIATRPDGVENRSPVNPIAQSAAPFDQTQRYTLDGTRVIIGRAPSGLPVGEMQPYGPTPRVMFRAPAQPWDAGTELGT